MVRVALLLVIVVAGCRSSTKSGPNRDPLYGKYIPKTDLPLPEKRDPLLTAPVSNPKGTSNREPFRNTKETSIAGLASRVKVENSGLSLGDRSERKSGTPLVRESESWSDVAEQLRELKARYDAPRLINGEYVMTAVVPHGNATRSYEASGPSAASAARELLKQVQQD